jgi:hypothetical protein
MMQRYWQRVLDYRYDPCQTTTAGIPFPPDFLSWFFPTTRVWLAALWFALWNPCL